MRVPIASDHAGFELKQKLMQALPRIPWDDLGPASADSVDYPDFADRVVKAIASGQAQRGVLLCGSGQGMAMRANKHPEIRAALVWAEELAKLARQHNDANVLCLPSRFLSAEQAARITEIFMDTEFEGGRHAGRVSKLNQPFQGEC